MAISFMGVNFPPKLSVILNNLIFHFVVEVVSWLWNLLKTTHSLFCGIVIPFSFGFAGLLRKIAHLGN